MEWLLVLLVVLITSSDSDVTNASLLKNYVIASQTMGCSDDQDPCLTLQEYASQPDTYFANNTIFYFEPGSHTLNRSFKLENLHNFTFQGLADSEVVNVMFSSFISIIWENCSNVEVSFINFVLLDYYTYSIVFEQTQIHLHNISITGNGYFGCSAIMCRQSDVGIKNSIFVGLQGSIGAALMISESCVTFAGNNAFADNTASIGGSLYLFGSVVILTGINIFVNNNSSDRFKISICKYDYNPWETDLESKSLGGAIYCTSSTLIINSEYTILFTNNFAQESGGAIAALDANIIIQGSTSFERIENGGAMCTFKGIMDFVANTVFEYESFNKKNLSFMNTVRFSGNSAMYGGAIRNVDSEIKIHGDVYFENNRAFEGGAMIFIGPSKLILAPAIHISFVLNHAESMGGALYFEDSQCSLGSILPIECFLSIHGDNNTTRNISLLFLNNSAGSVGSTLYGGQLNKCRLYYRTDYSIDQCGNKACNDYSDDALETFMNMSIIVYNESELATNISSQAEKIMFCQGEEILISDIHFIKIHPGERFTVMVIALGQTDSPVPTTVFSQNQFSGDQCYLGPSSHQILNGSCTTITFKLFSVEETYCYGWTVFKLYPENPCQSLADGVDLYLEIVPCPIGFKLLDDHCMCSDKLLKFTQKCKIENSIGIIERMWNTFWISQTNTDTLIIHEYRCPLDYCKDVSVDVSLNISSVQCDFNRNGTLCGQCKENFSLALGSLHCISCSNKHTTLILFFLIAGIALIAITFLLQFTVSVGTLNGLLFYANIIQANHQAYFPRAKINFCTIFISWLNLNFGIETCFYDGLDIHAYSWFQFLFPFYLWFLVGCIILACHYSQSIATRFGQNPVAVLATLLLMSYSKILSAVIVPLSWTYLTYYTASNETKSVVWLYDASIIFFREPKHIALGLFAIASLVVFVLPYIILLFFGHWLQGCSSWWILSWLNKLKPFMDANHAPYKKNTRYWTGLLIISRLGLFLIFANDSESVNIAAVTSVSVALLAIRFRVYEHFYNDILESSFILNLGIFSVATFYLKEKPEDANSQLILSSISVGIAFLTFIGILIFHISLVLKLSSIWKVHLLPFIQKSILFSKILRITPATKDKNIKRDEDAAELHTLPTSTEIDVDLREPLLDIFESQVAA